MDEGGEPQSDFSAAEWDLVKDLVFTCQSDPPADVEQWLQAQNASPKVRREVLRLLKASSDCGTFLGQSASEKHLGVRLHQPLRIGRYRVLDEIGSGGSGVVYSAWDESLNRKVALKLLRPEVAQDAELQRRLRWDARAASALQHPNIVVVHDVGSDQGTEYVAMECISGQTLARCIKPGGLEAREVLHYAIQICSGLEAAHAAGIVHRDLKPGNIMITEQGVVKILDFGLAKNCDAGLDSKDAPQTVEGRFAGTVAYVSPEQADAKSVDARSDIFSFGSVLFEMLTGRQAFPGNSALSVLADIMLSDPKPPHEITSRVDPRFDEVVRRCLRKDRERRFQSIAEVRVRLQELEDQLLHGETQIAIAPPPRPVSKWRAPTLLAAGVLLSAAAAGGVWFWLSSRGGAEEPFRLQRITDDRGFTGYPAISKDGTLLAYASDRSGGGNLDIWVQHVNSNEAKQITSDPADDYGAVFSPDGSRIAFRSERDGGGIYTVSTLGGADHLLVAQGRDPQFSPDGNWIAYWTGVIGASLYQGSVKIFIIPAFGGVPEQFQPGFQACAYPRWSPDGQRILFLGRGPSADGKGTRIDWWTAPAHGNGPARFTALRRYWARNYLNQLPLNYWLVPAAWMPDETLLFAAGHIDSNNIWALHLDPEGMPRGDPRRLTGGTAFEWHPSATEAGGRSLLAYEAMTVDSDLWRVRLDAHAHAADAPERFLTGFSSMASSSLTSDGKGLVFAAKQATAGGRFSIRKLDLKSNQQSLVTNVSTRNLSRPIVSGDGRMVVYWANTAGFLVPAGGGAARQICARCGPPTHLSFDGRSVLFEAVSAPEQIELVANGAPPTPVVALDPPRFTIQSGGRFSPDGRWMAFSAGNPSSPLRQIFIAPFHPGRLVSPAELIPFTDGDTTDIEPYWAPNGKTIFFLSRRDGFRCIWARAVGQSAHPSGAAYPVAHFHHAGRALGGDAYAGDIGLSVGPDFLVFSLLQSTTDVWLKTQTVKSR